MCDISVFKKIYKIKFLILAGVIVFLIPLFVLVILNMTVRNPSGYTFQCEMKSMPFDDVAFADWIRQQPGVSSHTVSVFREGKTLIVRFVSVQTGYGNPPLPDLDGMATEFGYTLEAEGFYQRR